MKENKILTIIIVAAGLGLILIWLMNRMGTAVHAATFTVNSTTDAVDANPGNGSCATSSGVCTLRAAIQEANALAGDDTITLPAGTYILSITGTDEDMAATGDLDITDSLTINGNAANTTIIDGNATDRVFQVFKATTLQNVTLQNGIGYDSSIFSCGGGGIRHNGGTLTITNSLITNNTTTQNGGGICNFTSSDIIIMNSTIDGNSAGVSGGGIHVDIPNNLSLVNSIVSNNTAYRGGGVNFQIGQGSRTFSIETTQIISNTATERGGGVYFNAESTSDSAQLEIVASTFEGNQIPDNGNSSGAGLTINGSNNAVTIRESSFNSNESLKYSGGGIANLSSDSTITISDSKFTNNVGVYSGGSIYNDSDNTTIAITNTEFNSNTGGSGGAIFSVGEFDEININKSQFISNSVTGASGGAIYFNIGQDSLINITNSAFNNNASSYSGGAIVNVLTTANITGTTFTNNHSGNGGAIHAAGEMNIKNSTFSSNQANESGGGLFADSTSGVIALNNSTVAYNIADDNNNGSGNGGGFALTNGASMLVTNSIIANNLDQGGESHDCDSPYNPVSSGYNLVGQGDGCNWSVATGDLVGTAVSPINPILEPLTGLPATHPLGIGSPAIDAGSPGPVSGLLPNCESVDQNGIARPFDGDGDGTAVCDIGAFEWADFSYVYLPVVIK